MRISAAVVFRGMYVELEIPDGTPEDEFEDYIDEYVVDHVSCDVYVDGEYKDSLVDAYMIEDVQEE